MEKETSFLDAQKTNEFGLTNPLGWNKVSIHSTKCPVDKAKKECD